VQSDPLSAAEATVIVPAYNEEDGLAAVLSALAPLRERGIEILVVDDGSTDRTSAVAHAAGHRVVRLERNQGKAAAVRAGLAALVDTEKVVVVDADGTYPVNAIPAIVRLLDDHDVVLGVRTEGRTEIPPLNRVGNAALRTVIHLFSGFRSADPLTGLYGVRRTHLEAMQLRSHGFGIEAEICVKAARMGLRWHDYPITYAKRIGESKLSPLRDGTVIAWTILRTLFGGSPVRPRHRRRGPAPAAPLAMAVTISAVALMTAGAIAASVALAGSIAVVIQPSAQLLTRLAVPGVIGLASGLLLWHLSAHWGHPIRPRLALVAASTMGAVAVAVIAAVLLADRLDLVPSAPGLGPVAWGLLISAAGVIAATPAAVAAVRHAPRARDWWQRPLPGQAALASRGELVLLVGVLAFFALPVIRLIAIGQTFGFDEAIYALTARSWVEGTPNTGWSTHRSPGISVLGIPALAAPSEAAFRTIGLLFGLGALIAAWRLGRRLAGPGAGLLAAFVIATIPELQLNTGLFLTDVPSAAILLVLMVVAWTALEQDPSPRRLMWLAPIAAAAFYVRYGAAVPIAFIAATIVLLWPARLLAAWRYTLATAILLLLLLLPHFIPATFITGTPWGVAMGARGLAAPDYLGQALEGYVRQFPSGLAGPIAGIFMTLGILAWPARLLASGWRARESRALTFLVLPALAIGTLLGLVTLAQTRYIFLPLMLLCIAGAVAAVSLASTLGAAWRRAATVALLLSVTVVGLDGSSDMVARQAAYAPTQWKVIDAAVAIREDAAGGCSVLSYAVPHVTWYSGCETYHFGFPPVAGRERLLEGEHRYLLLFLGARERQPSGALLEEYLALAEPEPFAVIIDHVSGEPGAVVYRMGTAD
jgi:hypothetical protein